MDIGRTVKRWRKRAGLSQADLAASIGTRQPQIARIERGRQSPRLDTLEAILDVCGAELRVEARRPSVDAPPQPTRPATPAQMQVLRQLAFHRVRCVVVGPLAERLRGADVSAPAAVSIVARRDAANRRKLSLVRRAMALPLRRAAPLGVRFEPYEELAERAGPTAHTAVPVISLEDLIDAHRTPTERLLLRIREAGRSADA